MAPLSNCSTSKAVIQKNTPVILADVTDGVLLFSSSEDSDFE